MTDTAAHRAAVEAWRHQRYAALRREIGWLTLAGLDWLKPGVNRIGTAPASEIMLPSGPAEAGTVTLSDGGVLADGMADGLTVDGQPVRDLQLVSDLAGDPTMLELGALRLCLIDRGGRKAIRTWDTAAPARRAFDGIEHWPIDTIWRLESTFEPTPGRTVRVPDVLGLEEDDESPGDVVFEVAGVEHRLQALAGGDAGELWLVFGDATNGQETYGGGRFLYTGAPDADGRVVVDFNRAYNPPCVFSPYATCPLPWPANGLPIRVEAGERNWDHHPTPPRPPS
ncbi:MAG: uncharacterized protein QOI85_1774 [Chloroflexota bacterium]|nr:uncharacterized protein [Chloroflexota bacterium]